MSLSVGGAVGPLAPFGPGIVEALAREGYSSEWTGRVLGLVERLSCWLAERGLPASSLAGDVVGEFFTERQAAQYHCRTPRSLRPVLEYLRTVGALADASSAEGGGPAAQVLAEFASWCITQRALDPSTVSQYMARVERFLVLWRPSGGRVVEELNGRAVVETLCAAAAVMPGPSLRCLVTAVRTFLRFLHATGRSSSSLVGAVPPLKGWPRTALPSTVPLEVVHRLVASCDAGTTTGLRDAAVLVVLGRLALRAKEVAGLSLDDLHWRVGEVTVRGKGGRVDRLPLPSDVGQAVADYLTGGRPQSRTRAVFLTAKAPIVPLSSDAVATVVARACARTGVARMGPHLLRRACATNTLRAGAPMTEVAQLLRHADLATSAIYASADSTAVAALARPWPQVQG